MNLLPTLAPTFHAHETDANRVRDTLNADALDEGDLWFYRVQPHGESFVVVAFDEDGTRVGIL